MSALLRVPCSCSCGSKTLWGWHTTLRIVLMPLVPCLMLLMTHQPYLHQPRRALQLSVTRCTACHRHTVVTPSYCYYAIALAHLPNARKRGWTQYSAQLSGLLTVPQVEGAIPWHAPASQGLSVRHSHQEVTQSGPYSQGRHCWQTLLPRAPQSRGQRIRRRTRAGGSGRRR